MSRKTVMSAATHERVIADLNRESVELTRRAEELRLKGEAAFSRDKALMYSEDSKALIREVAKIGRQIIQLQKDFELGQQQPQGGWLSSFLKNLFVL